MEPRATGATSRQPAKVLPTRFPGSMVCVKKGLLDRFPNLDPQSPRQPLGQAAPSGLCEPASGPGGGLVGVPQRGARPVPSPASRFTPKNAHPTEDPRESNSEPCPNDFAGDHGCPVSGSRIARVKTPPRLPFESYTHGASEICTPSPFFMTRSFPRMGKEPAEPTFQARAADTRACTGERSSRRHGVAPSRDTEAPDPRIAEGTPRPSGR